MYNLLDENGFMHTHNLVIKKYLKMKLSNQNEAKYRNIVIYNRKNIFKELLKCSINFLKYSN